METLFKHIFRRHFNARCIIYIIINIKKAKLQDEYKRNYTLYKLVKTGKMSGGTRR